MESSAANSEKAATAQAGASADPGVETEAKASAAAKANAGADPKTGTKAAAANSNTAQAMPAVRQLPKIPLPAVLRRGWALVTGGTSGLGLAFAHALAAQGMNLVLVARNEKRLQDTAQMLRDQYGVQCEVLAADLLDRAGMEAIKARLVQDKNPVSVLINNAGGGLYSTMITADYTEIRDAAEVMGLAPMELGGTAAEAMLRRGVGLIITTASVSALVPMGAYSAIKSLVKVWSDSLALKLQGTGVHVLSFLPGWVHTEFHQRKGVSNDSIPGFLWLEADRVVAETLEAAAKGKTSVTPAKRFKMLSFLAVHAPQPLVNRVVTKLNKGRR